MTKVLVCGGRDYLDRNFCYRQLDTFHKSSDGPITEVIHGGARGADEFADRWAKAEQVQVRPFKVTKDEWERYGKAAGPMRNQRMLEQGCPDFVLAFKGGKGTADMVRKAEAAGVRVQRVGWGTLL